MTNSTDTIKLIEPLKEDMSDVKKFVSDAEEKIKNISKETPDKETIREFIYAYMEGPFKKGEQNALQKLKSYIQDTYSTKKNNEYDEYRELGGVIDAHINISMDNFRNMNEQLRKTDKFNIIRKPGEKWSPLFYLFFIMMIILVIILTIAFASVSALTLLNISWDGLGSSFLIRDDALEYVTPIITALLASLSGVLMKLVSVNNLSPKTNDTMSLTFSILIVFLVMIYIPLITNMVQAPEFGESKYECVYNFNFIKLNCSSAFIILHLLLEMMIIFVSSHILFSKYKKKERISNSPNQDYFSIDGNIKKQSISIEDARALKGRIKGLEKKYESEVKLLIERYEVAFRNFGKTMKKQKQ